MLRPSPTMRSAACLLLLVVTLPIARAADAPATPPDPYLWLEDVLGERALQWVEERNAESRAALTQRPGFEPLRERLLAIFDSRERIPYVSKHGRHYYNFWRDAEHVRGIWRRTTPAEYAKAAPAWETVLDLDALAAAEGENWVWKGAVVLPRSNDRALVRLSRGGGDAVVVREFDLVANTWVEGGFALDEAKSDITWIDRDRVFVGTDFGPGTLTTSGYPRQVKLWHRGAPLADAALVYEAQPDDLEAVGVVAVEPESRHELIVRVITFYSRETFLRREDGTLTKLELPLDAEADLFHDHLLVTLRTEWTVGGETHPAGALLATELDGFLAGKREFARLFEPGPRKSLAGFSATRHHLILNELEDVRSRLYVLTPSGEGWERAALPAPEYGTSSAFGIDPLESDEYFLNTEDFLTPDSLYHGTIGEPDRTLLKQLPAFFDSSGLKISQHEAVSPDGTRVPYFQVARADLPANGSAPTLLYGYGGFEVSLTPSYSPGVGAGWLEQGGVYVLANIRGGGEFGPAWHQAALKANRQRAYDDFIAVAEDLIRRGITSPPRLGIMGGSNGGLLVGAVLTQRPELFGAVVCQVPLLDMRRYHQLLAGASWMGEYGNPDVPEEWAYISKYSPYQNVRPGVEYPPTLFLTSTRDDRVHPGHARKMAARMQEQGHTLLYYENTEGGHAGAADNRQQAFMNALAYTFLRAELIDAGNGTSE